MTDSNVIHAFPASEPPERSARDRLLEDVEEALRRKGGVAYLERCAEESPAAFLAMAKQAMTLRKIEKEQPDERQQSVDAAIAGLQNLMRDVPAMRSPMMSLLDKLYAAFKESDQ